MASVIVPVRNGRDDVREEREEHADGDSDDHNRSVTPDDADEELDVHYDSLGIPRRYTVAASVLFETPSFR